MTAAGFPLLLNPFASLFVLEREQNENAEYAGRFQLLLGETQLAGGPMQVNFLDKNRTRQMIRLDGLVIAEPGIVTARFWIGDHLQGEYSFVVEGPPAPPQVQITTNPA